MSLNIAAKWALGSGLARTGLHRRLLGDAGTVVAFHRVNDDIPEDGLTKSSRDFERFCRFFRANFDVVSLDDFVAKLRRGESLNGQLAITFDDGYLDNARVAAPILKKLGLPATFFVATRYLGSDVVPFWDENLPKRLQWMTWDDVRTMSREGFDIGAHTRTHVDLGATDGETADWEIAGSRDDIVEELGRTPRHFAYPFGRRDNMLEVNRERVAAAGFQCCVSCYGGLAPAGTDPFRLRRVPISSWYRNPEQFMFESLSQKAPD